MGGFPAQYLKHGKALCGKAFGAFVETFNALVDIAVNMSGDADGNNGQGHVHFDRSDPLHPVIRCGGCEGNGCEVTANEKSGLTVNDGEIDLSGRNEKDSFGIHKLSVETDSKGGKKEYLILSDSDVSLKTPTDEELDNKIDDKIDKKLKDLKRVESLNGEDGAVTIAGGHKVNVSKSGKTITISLDEQKEDPSRDPNTNCGDHPGSEAGGGVPAGGGAGGGAGVPAGGGSASGGVGCNC